MMVDYLKSALYKKSNILRDNLYCTLTCLEVRSASRVRARATRWNHRFARRTPLVTSVCR